MTDGHLLFAVLTTTYVAARCARLVLRVRGHLP
jgi:hypothetical protein